MPLIKFLRSTIGLKIIMGLTGAVLFAFTVVHMIGNLQIFSGPKTLNDYAQFLHISEEGIWAFRISLFCAAVAHIISAIALTIRNRAARGDAYAEYAAPGASWASRTMAISGIIVAAFIIFHLLHFTTLTIDPSYKDMKDAQYATTYPGFERHDVYTMVVKAFSNVWISAFYIISVGCLSFHLSHGIGSMFRSLGLTNPAYIQVQEWFGWAFAVLIFLGMAAVPAAVLSGIVHL